MEFVTIRLGGPGRIFPEDNRVEVPFSLSAPVTAVYPLLQSFRFINHDGDKHVEDVQVRLQPLFNAGVSTTDGKVEIETTFQDSEGLSVSADLVEMEVVVLVVGV
jgi:hypothetical protein